MKIAYLINEDLDKHPGLSYKINSQINFFESEGFQTFRVFHSDGKVIDKNGEIIIKIKPPVYSDKSKISLVRKLSWQYKFIAESLNKIKPDVTYSRYLFPAPNINKVSMYSGKLIIEINSDDRSEYMQKNIITGFYNSLFRKYLLRSASGLVFVTNELSRSDFFAKFTDRRTVVANGVNIKDYLFKDDPNNLNPQLIFVGSPGQSWHGLDKIKELAESLPDCFLHIVGPDNNECDKLWGYIPENVYCHGYLSNDDVQNILKTMDVGIGTLALYRKSMNESCSLKMRQYLAQGLPVIGGSKDTDIDDDELFYLELPNNSTNIVDNLDKIREFIYFVFGNTKMRRNVRLFAEANLAIESKEKKRVEFIKYIASK